MTKEENDRMLARFQAGELSTAELFATIRREAVSRRTRGPAYKHSRWARCVYCGLLRKYKVSRQRRLRSQSCQECNRSGGLHPPTWWAKHGRYGGLANRESGDP